MPMTMRKRRIGTPHETRLAAVLCPRHGGGQSAKHWDKAEADVKTALKLSPDQPELLNYLGYTWVDRDRKIPEALTMLEKARKLAAL